MTNQDQESQGKELTADEQQSPRAEPPDSAELLSSLQNLDQPKLSEAQIRSISMLEIESGKQSPALPQANSSVSRVSPSVSSIKSPIGTPTASPKNMVDQWNALLVKTIAQDAARRSKSQSANSGAAKLPEQFRTESVMEPMLNTDQIRVVASEFPQLRFFEKAMQQVGPGPEREELKRLGTVCAHSLVTAAETENLIVDTITIKLLAYDNAVLSAINDMIDRTRKLMKTSPQCELIVKALKSDAAALISNKADS